MYSFVILMSTDSLFQNWQTIRSQWKRLGWGKTIMKHEVPTGSKDEVTNLKTQTGEPESPRTFGPQEQGCQIKYNFK